MVKLEKSNTAAFLAGGVTQGGCKISQAGGVFGVLSASGHFKVTNDIGTSGTVHWKILT